MKRKLSTDFNTRQYMEYGDFEIFYYRDLNLNHISSHLHDYYEFYLFLDGCVTYEIEGKCYELRPGDYLLIPPGRLHHPIFSGGRNPYRRFVLWIGKEYYDRLCLQSPDFGYGFDQAAGRGRYRFHPDSIVSQELQGKLLDLLTEYRSDRPFGRLNAILMAASFLLYVNRITFDLLHQVPPAYENLLYLNLCDYIEAHLEEDLTLNRLASFFYVSKYHIAHTFKDHMGISLHQYIIKKRLQACKNGILSGIPFTKVCTQYGFHDYTSFYRAFKKEFGLSPKDFREQRPLPEELEQPAGSESKTCLAPASPRLQEHPLHQEHIERGSRADAQQGIALPPVKGHDGRD